MLGCWFMHSPDDHKEGNFPERGNRGAATAYLSDGINFVCCCCGFPLQADCTIRVPCTSCIDTSVCVYPLSARVFKSLPVFVSGLGGQVMEQDTTRRVRKKTVLKTAVRNSQFVELSVWQGVSSECAEKKNLAGIFRFIESKTGENFVSWAQDGPTVTSWPEKSRKFFVSHGDLRTCNSNVQFRRTICGLNLMHVRFEYNNWAFQWLHLFGFICEFRPEKVDWVRVNRMCYSSTGCSIYMSFCFSFCWNQRLLIHCAQGTRECCQHQSAGTQHPKPHGSTRFAGIPGVHCRDLSHCICCEVNCDCERICCKNAWNFSCRSETTNDVGESLPSPVMFHLIHCHNTTYIWRERNLDPSDSQSNLWPCVIRSVAIYEQKRQHFDETSGMSPGPSKFLFLTQHCCTYCHTLLVSLLSNDTTVCESKSAISWVRIILGDLW